MQESAALSSMTLPTMRPCPAKHGACHSAYSGGPHRSPKEKFMQSIVRKLRLILAAFALAGIAALAYSAFPSVSAHAQDGQGRALVFKSAGPIQMNHNESVLIGL